MVRTVAATNSINSLGSLTIYGEKGKLIKIRMMGRLSRMMEMKITTKKDYL